ncbi:MAG: CopG family transcriptional regulator [Methanotrichaceae archaeon]
MAKRKRVQVVFTNEQWSLIERFRGDLGVGDAEIVRNIVLAWLSEKSIISTNAKNKMSADSSQER